MNTGTAVNKDPGVSGLYIHIPFCRVKCRFCDFAAYPGLLKEIPRYLKALQKEMSCFSGRTVDTIYLGGGTPTILQPEQIISIYNFIRTNFKVLPGYEATVECNPEDVNERLLDILRASGVTRLSFGLQAVQQPLLKKLGRQHDFGTFHKAYRMARAQGFKSLNVDLMYGLPGQGMPEWEETLEQVMELSPEHISAYALSIEQKTVFSCEGLEIDGDLQADMYDLVSDKLESNGFTHYEISNFARPGFESRHNLRYWKNMSCLGAGVSAAWYDGGVRRKNNEKVLDYINAVEEGRSPVIEETKLTEPEMVGEDLMLALRLKEGVEISSRARTLYGGVLEKFIGLGFLIPDGKKVMPTRKGWLLSNVMFRELLSPEAPV